MNTPDAGTVLRAMAGLISAEHPPVAAAGAPGGYGRQQLGRSPMMLLAIAEEFDRAAHWRAQENVAVRQLLAQGASLVDDLALRQRMADASMQTDPDLRVSQLEASNRQLRALLIELHAWVQQAQGAPAARLDEEIWRELSASTERRRSLLDRF